MSPVETHADDQRTAKKRGGSGDKWGKENAITVVIVLDTSEFAAASGRFRCLSALAKCKKRDDYFGSLQTS